MTALCVCVKLMVVVLLIAINLVEMVAMCIFANYFKLMVAALLTVNNYE